MSQIPTKRRVISETEFSFWELALVSTLMVVFFPWSLLFCLFFYGWDETVLLCRALIIDVAKTAMALIAGITIVSLDILAQFDLKGGATGKIGVSAF